MKDVKSIILLIIIIILIGAAAFLTYMISNGQDPLVLINSRASGGEQEPTENSLASSAVASPTVPPKKATVSPTKSFASTSPSPKVTPVVSLIPSITPLPTLSQLPETGGSETPTSTPTIIPVSQLPVAGRDDFIHIFLLGGGALVLLAFLL